MLAVGLLRPARLTPSPERGVYPLKGVNIGKGVAPLRHRAYSLRMATAKIRTETTETVSLQLTLAEAEALSTALAHVGWNVTNSINSKLAEAGVTWDESQEFRNTQNYGCIIAVEK